MSDASRGATGDFDALRAAGAAGAGEPGIEHASAGEPSGGSLLAAVLAAVQSQVPQSAERERVLGARGLPASGVNKATARSLAGTWGFRVCFWFCADQGAPESGGDKKAPRHPRCVNRTYLHYAPAMCSTPRFVVLAQVHHPHISLSIDALGPWHRGRAASGKSGRIATVRTDARNLKTASAGGRQLHQLRRRRCRTS